MKKNAFTLIEFVIALFIIGLLVTVGSPPLVGYFQNMKIRNVADQLQAALQQAKTEAIRRNTPINLNITSTGWDINLPDPVNGNPTILLTRQMQTSEANVILTPSTIALKFTGRGTLSPFLPSFIQLTSPSSGNCQNAGGPVRCLNMKISAAGSIKVCDPALSNTDPRAC